MATNFPASLDTLTNPTSSDSLSSPSHSAQHANVNDAVEALQAKVGADSSAVTSSHDYKIADHASRLTTLEGAAGSGLVFISRTTIGSAVSSVTVSNAFSTDYDSYRIVVSGGSAGSSVLLHLRIGALTTLYYWAGSETTYGGSSVGLVRASNAAYWYVGVGHPNFLSADISVQNPYTTEMPSFSSTGAQGLGSSSGRTVFINGFVADTTSHTDFTLLPSSGTMTGGTIDVYGYAKA